MKLVVMTPVPVEVGRNTSIVTVHNIRRPVSTAGKPDRVFIIGIDGVITKLLRLIK